MDEGIKKVFRLLKPGRIKEALAQLEGISENCNDWELYNQIREQQTAYNYLLQYAGQNIVDPNRKKIFQQVYKKAYELADRMNISLKALHTNFPFYEHIRAFKKQAPKTYLELLILLESYTEDISTLPLLYPEEQQYDQRLKICQQHEKALNELFNKTWVNLHWSETEAEEAWKIMESLLVSSNDKTVLVSAVTLSLTHIIDERKIQFIFKACQEKDLQVSQRALVGLFLTLFIYENRIEMYPELQAGLSLLTEQNNIKKNLIKIQSDYLISQETHKIAEQMKTEIIPNIIKNSSPKKGNIFLNGEEGDEFNPEWETFMEKSGLNESIRKITEFQLEGADIHMGTFAYLKNFPFFNEVSHWFYPFDFNQPELLLQSKDLSKEQINSLNFVLQSETFCESDKYSFVLSFIQMPLSIREQNMQKLQIQTEMDEEKKEILKEYIKNDKIISDIDRHYIQDMYRYYNIFLNKYPEENNIFQYTISLWNNKWCKHVFTNEVKKDIADFLLQKRYYINALEVYRNILINNGETAEIHQKIGFILQKKKKYQNAIMSYERADLLMPDHLWTLRHLAQCAKLNHDYGYALELYQRIEQMDPDNLSITQQIGECLTRMHKFQEAIPNFHKILYWDQNAEKAQRAIAWCYFRTQKYDNALKYYKQLLESDAAQKQDWLNVGHVYIVQGLIPEAANYYSKAKELCKNYDDFMEMLTPDMEMLTQYIDKESIMIALDLLV